MGALANYAPVIGFMDRMEAKYPDAQAEAFHDGWTDPLDLYGAYPKELMKPGVDLGRERPELQGLLDEKGPDLLWQDRLKLVAEMVFWREF